MGRQTLNPTQHPMFVVTDDGDGGGDCLFDQCFDSTPFTSDVTPLVVFNFTPVLPAGVEGQFTIEYIVQSYGPDDAARKTRRLVALFAWDGNALFFTEQKEVYNVGTADGGTVQDASTPDGTSIDINAMTNGGDPSQTLTWEVHVEGRFERASVT